MSLPTISSIPLPDSRAGLTTAGAFLSAYNEASQLAMQQEQLASDLQMRDHQMQRQDQLMRWEGEDRQYQNDVIRPLEEQKMRLGNASEILGLQQQGADLRYREEMTRATSLRTGSDNAIYDSFNNDPRIRSGLEAGMRLFGGQGAGAPGANSIGKATRYGYANDSTPDSNSRAGIGAWVSPQEQARIKAGEDTPNRLRSGDLALSPDVERAMRMAGIKPGQTLALQYADGSEHVGRWMDRTATSYQGKALTGRFDIYDPDGSHAARDGHPVVSFKRAGDDTAAPIGASQVQTMRDAESVLDAYEAATEYVQKFTRQDSRGNLVLDPRAQPIAEQALAMETAIKANPMLSGMAQQRVNQRQEEAAQKAVSSIMTFHQPGQFEDFRARQPGAFHVLQRWDMGQDVPREHKMQAVQMLQAHAANYKPGQNAAKALPASALTMLQTIGKAQAMPRPQGKQDPSDPKKVMEPDAKAMAEWEAAQAEAAGAGTALAAMAMYDPSVAEVYQRVFAPKKQQPGPKGPEGNQTPAPATSDDSGLTVDELLDRKKKSAEAQLELAKMDDVTASVNTLAAELSKEHGVTVQAANVANEILKDHNKPSGRKAKAPLHVDEFGRTYGEGAETAYDEMIPASQFYAEKLKLPVDELKRWAKAQQKGASASKKEIHRGLTPEQARMLPSGSLVEDQNGVLRTVP
ncbi:hypothetical protein SAMN02745166_01092 [Prosthecobacter debontii]|uniref:Uncharacterized protein n=1 Tax=Prosthecobacter debontii TaxID=48467 RepID=A0A1T4X675_9BACT|nr:hypothetical protein [Prosthecobacter debontii]SKA85056.1 hypothetical protein SAMN02745166_01092 [Prosthecobacter debontii]